MYQQYIPTGEGEEVQKSETEDELEEQPQASYSILIIQVNGATATISCMKRTKFVKDFEDFSSVTNYRV